MLLCGFLRVETALPPCHPGEAEWIKAEAELSDDISPVFPYLNAIMKGTIFDPAHQTLTFALDGRGVTLYPRKMVVTRLRDRKDAEEVLERLRKLINTVWERREEITPSYKTRAKLAVLEIYKLLPRRNCQACGEPTCMAFAAKLVSQQAEITSCRPLFSPEQDEARAQLFRLLEEAGYLVARK